MEKCCLQQAIERLGEGGDVSFSLSLSLSFSFSMRHSFDRYWFYRLELFYLLLSRWQKSWLFQVMMLQNCLISAGISRCCLSKPHQKCRETIECRVHAAIVYHYFLIEKKTNKKKPKKSEFQSIDCELSSSLTDAETSLDRFGVVRETHRGLEGKQTRPDHRVGSIDSPFVGIVNPLCHPNNVYFNQCLPRYSASVLISPAKTGRSESESDVTSWRMISPAWICRSFFEIPI